MKGPEDSLKEHLVAEIKREEWRKQIGEEEYAANSKICEEIARKNLELVTHRNKLFHKRGTRAESPKKVPPKWHKVSVKALEAYENWKQANHREKEYPKVSVHNLLLLVHYLDSEPDIHDKKELDECLRRQNSTFEVFWDSPTCILRALRQCVLKRDWANMTYFSLILLNYDKRYLQIVKSMCRIMVKLNPLVRQCGLEDQFRTLTDAPDSNKLVVV